MDSENYFKIYDAHEPANKAFLLNEGELVFVISDKNYFTVKGENIIFGAAELLYSVVNKDIELHHFKVYGKKDAKITEIPKKNLKHYISLYNVGFNITKFIARCVQKTNEILTEINKQIQLNNETAHKYYKFYFNLIERMQKNMKGANNKLIEDFIDTKEQTLPYRKGKAFSNAIPPKIAIDGNRINDFTKEYKAGTVICRQNEESGDLFILNHGKINVLLDDEEISTISDPGTVFGEMSLLLNETRSATLVAKNDSVINIINKASLKALSKQKPDFFLELVITLWERLKNNIALISEFEKLNNAKARLELEELAHELDDLYKSQRIGWLLNLKEEINATL